MPLVFAVPFNTRLLFSEEMRGWVLAVAPAFVFKLSTRPHCTLAASGFAHLLSESSRSLPALKGLHDMSEKQLVAGDGSTSKSVPCIRVQPHIYFAALIPKQVCICLLLLSGRAHLNCKLPLLLVALSVLEPSGVRALVCKAQGWVSFAQPSER